MLLLISLWCLCGVGEAARRLSFEKHYANQPDSEMTLLKAYIISTISTLMGARMIWTCCCKEDSRGTAVTLGVGLALIVVVLLAL